MEKKCVSTIQTFEYEKCVVRSEYNKMPEDKIPIDLSIDDLLPYCNFDENQTSQTAEDGLFDLSDTNWTNSYLKDFLVSDEFLNQQLDNFLSSNYTSTDNDTNNNNNNQQNTLVDPEGYSVLGVNLNLSCNNSTEEQLMNNDDNLINWTKFDEDFIFNDCLVEYQNNEIGNKSDTELTTQINLQTRETLNLINMFPHIADERNLKRRALLYESPVDTENLQKTKTGINKRISSSSTSTASINGYRERKISEEKHFPCSIINCDKVYSKPSHLRAHLKRHSGEKPFVCNWQNCTWKFSRSDELARHRRSHLGIKPYKCELCDRAFSRSDHLAKHNKVHKKKLAQFGTYQIRKRIR